MSVVAWLVVRELRDRWRSVLAVALLVGLAGGLVLATAAGARRTSSAYERFVAETATRDASVQIDDGDVGAILDEIEDLDLVATSGRLEIIPVLPTDESRYADVDLALFASPDGRWGADVDRPLVVEGRMPAPSAEDEVLLNEVAATQTGLTLGDRIEVATFTPAQLTALHSEGRFDGFGGPVVDLRVVGVGRQATDLQGADVSAGGVLLVSQTTQRSLDGRVGALRGMVGIELVDGASVQDLRAEVRRIVGPQGSFDVRSSAEEFGRSTSDAAAVLARALIAFAVAASVAGAVAVGGAITRQGATATVRTRTLGALGCDGRQRAVAGAAVPLAGVVVGSVIAPVGAYVASGRFPISVARRVEPDPGLHFDALVLGAGTGVLLALGVVWSLGTVRRLEATVARPQQRAWRPPALGLSASIGIGHTLDRRARDRSVPVRAALAASALGVLGVVGAATVVSSFHALVEDPARYGWTWSTEPDIYVEEAEALVQELAASPGIDAIAARHGARLELDGVVVPGVAFEQRIGEIVPPLRQGRLASASDEVVVGQRTAEDLGVSVGDHVTATTADGDGTVDVEVVGIGVFAPVETSDPAVGAALTTDGLEQLRRSDGYTSLLVRYRPEFDATALEASLMERELADFAVVYARPRQSGALENLGRTVPIVVSLGAFFAALAIAGLAHSLVVGTRRRHRDLATLRALGMRGVQVRRIVVVTALTTAAFGVVVGAPLGLAVGRAAWALIIGGQGLLDAPTAPVLVLLAVGPTAVVVAVAVSWWPSRIAADRPGHVLRAE